MASPRFGSVEDEPSEPSFVCYMYSCACAYAMTLTTLDIKVNPPFFLDLWYTYNYAVVCIKVQKVDLAQPVPNM